MTDRAQIAAQAAWQGSALPRLVISRLGHLHALKVAQAPVEGETDAQREMRLATGNAP